MVKKMKQKKYRIKSKFRFITFLVIMFVLIVGTGSVVLGLNDATAETKQTYHTEYVDPGETLWSIAKSNKSAITDTRQAVYEICKINDISADQLQSGMTLKIPDSL